MNRPTRSLPKWMLIPTGIATALFLLPLIGLLVETPWNQLSQLLVADSTVDALLLSLECSFTAALLCLTLGLPLATWLSQGDDPIRTAVRILTTLPMVLPPIVGGLALLLAFGKTGIAGGSLDRWFGIQVPFSWLGVVLATTYVAMPFFVLTVEAGMRAFDSRYADTAATLGARPWRTYCTITLPMIAPTLCAGLLIAWARALGEFGATITFAGSFQGRTRTMPLAVYHALESQPSSAIALSLVLLLISAAVLFFLRRQWFPIK
jgi:molybdate transport system permease protein